MHRKYKSTTKCGKKIASISVMLEDEVLYQKDFFLEENIYKKDFKDYIKDGIKNIFNDQNLEL